MELYNLFSNITVNWKKDILRGCLDADGGDRLFCLLHHCLTFFWALHPRRPARCRSRFVMNALLDGHDLWFMDCFVSRCWFLGSLV